MHLGHRLQSFRWWPGNSGHDYVAKKYMIVGCCFRHISPKNYFLRIMTNVNVFVQLCYHLCCDCYIWLIVSMMLSSCRLLFVYYATFGLLQTLSLSVFGYRRYKSPTSAVLNALQIGDVGVELFRNSVIGQRRSREPFLNFKRLSTVILSLTSQCNAIVSVLR